MSPFCIRLGRRSCRAHGSRLTEEVHREAMTRIRQDSEVQQEEHMRIRRISERIRHDSEKDEEKNHTEVGDADGHLEEEIVYASYVALYAARLRNPMLEQRGGAGIEPALLVEWRRCSTFKGGYRWGAQV